MSWDRTIRDDADALPTGVDFTNFMAGAGITLTAGLAADSFARQGVDQFEKLTGRRMLAVRSTANYMPPTNANGVLDLRRDLSAIESVVFQGTPLVRDTDYWLLPQDADLDNKPWFMIQFLGQWGAYPGRQRLVVVDGWWGYGQKVPYDAWICMLSLSAIALAPLASQLATEGILSWSDDGSSESYDGGFTKLITGWQAYIFGTPTTPGVIQTYKRVSFGGF